MKDWQATEADDLRVVQEILLSADCGTTDIYDLVNRRGGKSYKSAIPSLIEVLPRLGPNRIKEGVVRALGVREARNAGPALVREFKAMGPADSYSSEFDFLLHWAIGNALAAVAEDTLFDDLASLLQERSYGRAREMIALGLGQMRSRRQDAIQALRDRLAEGDLHAHVIDALSKLRATEALPDIQPLTESSNRLVRSEAKKAIRRLQKLATE